MKKRDPELYPVLRAHPETRALADHHDEQADELELLIDEVDGLAFDSPERRAAYQRLIDAVVSSCKMNTLLMDTLWNFVWEMFGKLMEYTKFPTKYYIMYPLVRYSF